MARSRRTLASAAGLTVVVLVAGAVAGWWFFIRSDAPERANIQTAGEVLAQQADDELAEVEGAWSVDTTVGSFADFTSTWAGYRFDEELVQIGTTTAVGRTPGVSGTMMIDGGKVMDVDVAVDLTTLKSDKDRRDQALGHRGLESDLFPTASFTLTEPIDLPGDVADAEGVSTTVSGELTVHGVTKELDVHLDATMSGSTVAVVGSAPLKLSDFGIAAPTGYSVLSIKDQGMFEFQIFFTKP